MRYLAFQIYKRDGGRYVPVGTALATDAITAINNYKKLSKDKGEFICRAIPSPIPYK